MGIKTASGINMMFRGAWGVVGKDAWIPFFFACACIGAQSSEYLRRLIGVMDITLGIMLVFHLQGLGLLITNQVFRIVSGLCPLTTVSKSVILIDFLSGPPDND